MNFLNKMIASPGRRQLAMVSSRFVQTNSYVDISLLPKDDRIICQAREKLKMKKILPNYIIKKSTAFLYEACTDKINIKPFFEHLELDDTLSSWFVVTRLHVWMVMTRIMREKTYGQYMRNELCKRMWEDCEARINKLAMMKQKDKTKILKTYGFEFNATMVSMDEGMLANDATMAGALWRTMFSMSKDVDPQTLDLIIGYTRAQLQHLSKVKTEPLLFSGDIDWKPYPPLLL